VGVVNRHGRRVAELESELAGAERRAASQHKRADALGQTFDPVREANIVRQVDGATDRLRRERQRT
jgi:hypothetical protein